MLDDRALAESHHIGDKLSLIERAASWLAPGGLFIAHLDWANVRWGDGQPAQKTVLKALRTAGCAYNPRQRLLRVTAPARRRFGLHYLGADDRAGPNFTGQPAVSSFYAPGSP